MNDLELRITTALTNDVPSNDIGMLLDLTEKAITSADAAVATERERCLDPVRSPDAKAAREAVASAEFARDRLRTVLPRLQARYDRMAAAEYLSAWRVDYEAYRIERDNLAAEFRKIYPTFERQIVDLLTRCSEMEAKLSRLHLARPAGVPQHLLEPELVARGLDKFTLHEPSIARELRLPKFAHDARLAWPQG